MMLNNDELTTFINSVIQENLRTELKNLKDSVNKEIKNNFPIGVIFAYPSIAIPENFLPCEGQELSISQYPDLYKILGYNFGGVINKTFCLPNLQGQFIRGLDREGNIDYERDSGDIRKIGSLQKDSFQGHGHTTIPKESYAGNYSCTLYTRKRSINYGQNTFSSDSTFTIREIISKNEAEIYYGYNLSGNKHEGISGILINSFRSMIGINAMKSNSFIYEVNAPRTKVYDVVPHTYGQVRVDSETRPVNIALIFCIKVK